MSKLSSPALIAKLAALCVLVIAASSSVFASPVGVSYTVSGSAGAWILDFSFTNNVVAGQQLYFFGVNLPQNEVGIPSSWIDYWDQNTSNTTFNPSADAHGGPNITYSDLFHLHVSSSGEIAFGATMSGFEVEVNTPTAPTSVQWFAFSADFAGGHPYLGGAEFTEGPESACMANGYSSCLLEEEENPGFAGTVYEAGATPEPSSLLLLGSGLLGLGPFLRRRLFVGSTLGGDDAR